MLRAGWDVLSSERLRRQANAPATRITGAPPTPSRQRPATQDQLDPNVQTGRVVWKDWRDVGPGQIYFRNLESGAERCITTNTFGGGWQPGSRVPLLNSFATLRTPPTAAPDIFYRAYEFVASPPILEALLETDRSGSVLLYGVPGRTYRLEQSANLGQTPLWTPGPQLNLTNSFTYIRGLIVTSNIFFRAHSE